MVRRRQSIFWNILMSDFPFQIIWIPCSSSRFSCCLTQKYSGLPVPNPYQPRQPDPQWKTLIKLKEMQYWKYSTSANPADHHNPTPSANVAKGPGQKPHVAVMMMVMMIRLPKLLSTPPSTTLMLPKTKVKVSNCCQHKHLQKRRKFLTFTDLLGAYYVIL